MKAIRVKAHGSPEALAYQDVPRPEPGPGEILVKIGASGVNFIDIYHRTGQYPIDPPFTPGVEAAGEVAAVGTDVSGFHRQDRVAYAMHRGSYAEYAVVDADKAVHVPDSVALQQAAGVMLQGTTAHYLSHSTYPLREHDVVLIHAAAGGVGSLLVQMAKLVGAHVIGTTSTEEKARIAGELGADEIILYTERDFRAEVERITAGQGVDVVYDGVGRSTFRAGLDCLKPRGMMVLFGQASGPVEPIDPQILNAKGSLFLTRPSLAHYLSKREELERRATRLFHWIADGSISVWIDRTFALSEAPDAHQYMEDRKTLGKLLLVP